MTLVDLGTEFGMLVEETGETEVHVFDGEVELNGVVAQAFNNSNAAIPNTFPIRTWLNNMV